MLRISDIIKSFKYWQTIIAELNDGKKQRKQIINISFKEVPAKSNTTETAEIKQLVLTVNKVY